MRVGIFELKISKINPVIGAVIKTKQVELLQRNYMYHSTLAVMNKYELDTSSDMMVASIVEALLEDYNSRYLHLVLSTV